MRLKSIRLAGVKGQHRQLRIGPVTIITGPNWSGKTSALLGLTETLHPASNTFGWLTGGTGVVQASATFEDGGAPIMVTRSFSPKHAVSMVPGDPSAGIRETAAAIAERLCRPEHLSVQSFADLSAAKREERIMLAAASIPEGVPTDDEALKALLPGFVVNLVGTPKGYRPEALVDWLSDALSKARSKKNQIAKDRKRVEGNLRELVEKAVDLPGGTLAEMRERRERLIAERTKLESDVAAIQRASGTATDLAEAIAKHRAEAAAANEALDVLRGEEKWIRREHEEKASPAWDAQKAIEEAEQAAARLHQPVASAAYALREAERHAQGAEMEAARLKAFADAFDHGDPCTTCGRPLDDSCIGADEARRGAAATADEKAKALEALADARRKHEEAVATLQQAEGKVSALREQHAAAFEAEKAADKEAEAKYVELRAKRADLEARYQKATGAAASLEEQLNKLPGDVDPDLVATQIEALTMQVEACDDGMDRLTRAQRDEEKRVEWEQARDDLTERFEGLKLALDTLELWRSGIVDPAVARIESTAGLVVDAVLPHARLGVDVTVGKGTRLVLRREDLPEPEPFDGWSGSERLVAGIGAHVAMLAAEAPPWRAVICDEVQACDKATFPHLVAAVLNLVDQGLVDNVIFAGCLEDHLPRVPEEVLARCVVHELPAPVRAEREAA